jgi:hypothetical protein
MNEQQSCFSRSATSAGHGEAIIWMPPHEPGHLLQVSSAKGLCVCTSRQDLSRPADILAEAIPEAQSRESEIQVTAMKSNIHNRRLTRDLLLPRLLSGQVNLAGV